MRSALASRLVIAVGLFGLVAAAAPADTGGRVRPVGSVALAKLAPDEISRPVRSAPAPAKQLAAPARPAPKPARAIPASRPRIRSTHPRLRTTGVSLGSSPRPAARPVPKPKPPPPSSGASNSAYESRILGLVNAQRTSHGLSAVSMSSCADSYAERWSAHLAVIGALVHQSMGGLLTGCRAQYVGENIGFGPVSADTMVAMWMASPEHRANVLNPRFTHIGIGAAQTSGGVWYAVQDFLDL